jgi:hypothetical protein
MYVANPGVTIRMDTRSRYVKFSYHLTGATRHYPILSDFLMTVDMLSSDSSLDALLIINTLRACYGHMYIL